MKPFLNTEIKFLYYLLSGMDEQENPFAKFWFKIPFFNQQNKASQHSVAKEESKTTIIGEGEAENGSQKPNYVRFPNSQAIVSPPIDVEFQESSGTTHDPVIIWQVYALGGFLILKWVWARWKERNERANKASDDDDDNNNRSSDEHQSSHDNE